jgi:hypothetical protein
VAKDLEPLEVQLWIDGPSKGLHSKIRRRQQELPVTIHESSSSEVNPLFGLGQGFDCRGYSEQPRRTLCWTSSGGAQGILRRSLAAVWLPVRGEDPRLALAVEECHFALVKPFSRLPQSFQRNPIWLSQALGRCAGPGRRPIPVRRQSALAQCFFSSRRER